MVLGQWLEEVARVQHRPDPCPPQTEGRAWGPAFTLKGAEISETRSCFRRAASSLLPNSLEKRQWPGGKSGEGSRCP